MGIAYSALGWGFGMAFGVWEWRYFVKLPLPEGPLPLEGKREDLYFPAGESLGYSVFSRFQ